VTPTILPDLPPDIAAAAASYASRGWHVFPCRPGDKRPVVDRWEQRACADPDRVARFWRSPKHNIGIATGPSGLVVLDLDTHGELPDEWRKLPGIHDGRDVLAQLCEWAGQPWPSTHMVVTPSGGWHLYYTAPEGSKIRNSASLLGPLVDIRSQGGYVIGAGSAVDGKPYEVLDAESPSPLPEWIHRLLMRRPEPRVSPPGQSPAPAVFGRFGGLVYSVETAPEGQRNNILYWASCRAAEMVSAGELGADGATAFLVSAAVAAGLPERDARKTVASAMRGDAR
jgi:hypothetical protein